MLCKNTNVPRHYSFTCFCFFRICNSKWGFQPNLGQQYVQKIAPAFYFYVMSSMDNGSKNKLLEIETEKLKI